MSKIEWDIVARDKTAAGFGSASKNFSKAEKSAAKFNKTTDAGAKSAKGFSTGAAVGFAAAGAAIVSFGASSVKAYAEAEQSQLKLEDAFARFPKLADVNIESLRDLNSALAQKTRFDDDAFASGQAVLAQFDLTGTQVKELTPLLADYAAKTGQDLPAAASALGKAFLGNTRALKTLGINYTSTGNKAQDVANITELLRQKVGGFAEKEGKTAAGQAEIWKNRLGELQEALGETVLKVANWAYENKALVITVASVVGAVAAARFAIKGWHAVVDTGRSIIDGYRATVERLSTTWGRMGSKGKAVVGALGGLAVVAGGVGLVIGALEAKSARAAARQQALADSAKHVAEVLAEQNGVVNENVRTVALQEAQQQGWVKMAREAGISARDLSDAMLGEGDARQRVLGLLDRHIAGMQTAGIQGRHNQAAFLLLRDAIGGYAGSLDTAVAEQKYISDGLATNAFWAKETASATQGLTDKYAAQVAQMDKILAKRRELAGELLSEREAQRSYQAALDDASAAIKENGATLDINTEAGRANAEKLDALAKITTEQVIPAMLKNGASNDVLRGKMLSARGEFIRTARQMGLSRAAANALADKLGLIPGNYRAYVDANTARAMLKTREIERYLNALNGNVYSVLVNVGAAGAGLGLGGFFGGGRAEGGPVKKGMGYWVGEKGRPEWFEPKQDGTIFTENQLRAGAQSIRVPGRGGGGAVGSSVMVQLQIVGSGGLADAIKTGVRKGDIRFVVDGNRVKVA